MSDDDPIAKRLRFDEFLNQSKQWGRNTLEEQRTRIMGCVFTFPLVIGTPCEIDWENRPDFVFQPERIMCNAPCAVFVMLKDLTVSGERLPLFTNERWPGEYDALSITPIRGIVHYDMRRLTPADSVIVKGRYTGCVPKGWDVGDSFPFMIRIRGRMLCHN